MEARPACHDRLCALEATAQSTLNMLRIASDVSKKSLELPDFFRSAQQLVSRCHLGRRRRPLMRFACVIES